MPQPKSSSSAKKPPARKRSAPAASQPASQREQLVRLLDPLGVVFVTRDRLQEVFDDAVQRGRMTRSDATDLVTEIVSRGKRTTEDLLGDVDQLLGGPADRVRREVDKARRATGIGPSFPILGYDDLSAAQVQSRLDELTPAQLRKVRDYERRNANRKTVLAAIEQRLS